MNDQTTDPFAQDFAGGSAEPAPPPPAGNDPFEEDFRGIKLAPGTSATGAFARGAARGAAPALFSLPAIGYGAEAGFAVGGPWGAIGGGLIGGFGGSYAIGKAQDWLLSKLPDSWVEKIGMDDRQRQLDEKHHGTAAFLGGMAPYALTMRPGGWARGAALPENVTALQRVMSHPATSHVFGGAVVGGMELGQEVIHGESPDWTKVGIATAFGVVFNKPFGIGESLTEFGARGARRTFGIAEPMRAPGAAAAGPAVAEETIAEPATPAAAEAPPSNVVPIRPDLTATEARAEVLGRDRYGKPFPTPEEAKAKFPPVTVADASDLNIMGPGVTEDVFQGSHQRSPDATDAARADKQLELSVIGPETRPHVYDLAKRMHPDLFADYERLQRERAEFAAWDNPQAKQHLAAVDAVLRKTYAEVSAALRRAAEAGGHETVPAPPPEAPPTRTIEQQREFIRNDVKRQLMIAGRPADEAEAAAAVVAARYETRANLFKGALGTPEELYRREGAEILGPGGRSRQPAEPRAPSAPRKFARLSLVQQIAANGGIKPTADLEAMLGGKHFVPGFGALLRETGKPIDLVAKEDVGEYLGKEATVRDLMEAIQREARGQRVWKPGEEPPAARVVAEAAPGPEAAQGGEAAAPPRHESELMTEADWAAREGELLQPANPTYQRTLRTVGGIQVTVTEAEAQQLMKARREGATKEQLQRMADEFTQRGAPEAERPTPAVQSSAQTDILKAVEKLQPGHGNFVSIEALKAEVPGIADKDIWALIENQKLTVAPYGAPGREEHYQQGKVLKAPNAKEGFDQDTLYVIGVALPRERGTELLQRQRPTEPSEIPSDATIAPNGAYVVPIKVNGRTIGQIIAFPRKDSLNVKYTNIQSENDRGQGHVVNAYAKLADWALANGLELHSDFTVTDVAIRIYEGLERRGYKVERNPDVRSNDVGVQSDAGLPVFKVTAGPERGELFQRQRPTEPSEMYDIPGIHLGPGFLSPNEFYQIKAYHGSPHDFDTFDLSKIGTGEGAQAYGHGLYFAEEPTVAAAYRNALAPLPDVGGPIETQAAQYLRRAIDRQKAIDELSETANNWDRNPNGKDVAEGYRKSAELLKSGWDPPNTGKLYQVSIKADPEHFLDWDKPLSEQNEHVNTALANAGVKPIYQVVDRNGGKFIKDGQIFQTSDRDEAAAFAAEKKGTIKEFNVGDLLHGQSQGGPEDISSRLREAGIPGIKYLDQGSRTAGEGSRNYVIFDDKLIGITHKDGTPVTGKDREDIVNELTQGTEADWAAREGELLQPANPTYEEWIRKLGYEDNAGNRARYEKRFGSATQPQVSVGSDVGSFAREVLRLAKSAGPEAKLGRDLVFINHVWRAFQEAHPESGLDFPAFKQRLREAWQAERMPLAIANVLEPKWQRDVAESRTEFGRHQWHVIDLAEELEQSARGKYKPRTAEELERGLRPILTLTKDSNASTFIHESGHDFLEQMKRDAAHELAPEQLKADAETTRKWLGLDSLEQLAETTEKGGPTARARRAHEKFATGFEQYLREGTAPSAGLARVFAQFRQWLTSLYQTIKGLGQPISEDIRGVFDRMLAEEPQRTVIAPEREATEPHSAAWTADKDVPVEQADATAARVAQERENRYAGHSHDIRAEHAAEEARTAAESATSEPGRAPAEGPGGPGAMEPPGGIAEPQSKSGGGGAGAGGGVRGGAPSPSAGLGVSGQRPASEGPGGERAHLGDLPLAPNPSPDLAGRDSFNVGKLGNVRTENITSVEQFASAIEEAKERIGGSTEPMTDGQVLDAAEAMGFDPGELTQDKLARAFGGVRDLNKKVLAFRMAVRDQAEKVSDLMQRYRDTGDEAIAVEYAKERTRFDMFMSVLSSVTTEWGRAGRSFRNMEGWDAVRMAARGPEAGSLEEFIRSQTGREFFQLKMEAKLGAALDSPAKVAKFLRDAQKRSAGGMILEYWINGLISGPSTHMTYAVGNQVLALQKAVPETLIAAAIGSVRRAFGRGGEYARAGEALAGVKGIVGSLPASTQAFLEAMRTGQTTLLPGEAARPLTPYYGDTMLHLARSITNDPVTWKEAGAELFGLMRGVRDGITSTASLIAAGGHVGAPLVGAHYSPLGQIPDIAIRGVPAIPLGSIARLPGRSVAAIHSFFRTMNYLREGAAEAYRQASDQNLSGNAFAAEVGRIRQNPTDKQMQRWRAGATSATLMAEGGAFVKALSRLTNASADLPFLGRTAPLKFVDPFVHIGANVINQAIIQRTPLGLLSGELRADLMGKNGNIAQDFAMARMIAGTGMAIAFGSLAMEGYATGSGPSDPAKAAMWRLAGNQPHSVRIGDMWYQVNRLGPIGMLLSTAADMYDVAHDAGEGEMLTAAAHLQHAITQNILDESFMRGPADLMKAMEDPGRYGEGYLKNFTSSFVPFSVGMFQIARAADPYARQARDVVDAMKQKIPGMSETLWPRRDIWGEPLPNPDALGHAGLTAIYMTKVGTDPVNRAMLELGIAPAKLERKIRNQDLTDDEYDNFTRVAGRMAKMRLDQIVRSPDWQVWPPHIRHDVIETVIKQSREAGRGFMMMKYPHIPRDAAEDRRALKTGAEPYEPIH